MSYSQQLSDTLYRPELKSKVYPENNGTTVFIDEAHNNFHIIDGRYYAFAKLIKSDGYQVKANKYKFTKELLREIKILVIANAEANGVTDPVVKPTMSAFSSQESRSLKRWVKKGGSFFLIADHMPFAGASASLARKFGFTFYDGFVMYDPKNGNIDFSVEDKRLSKNFITIGRDSSESVNKIRTFTGQAFKTPKNAISILNLDKTQTVYLTDTMWVFNEQVKRFPATGLSQGAIMKYGKGKVAIFGEAAMFTAQIAGSNKVKVGMNSKEAQENYQLLLNLIHWLDNKLESEPSLFK